jgi:hypothetical protein
MRKDMARSIRQYEGRLTNLLRNFEVCRPFGRPFRSFSRVTHRLQIALVVDARFEQISMSYQERDSSCNNDSSGSGSRSVAVTVVQSTQRSIPDRRGGGPVQQRHTGSIRFESADAKLRRRIGSFAPYAIIYVFPIYWFPFYAVLFLCVFIIFLGLDCGL